MHGVRDRAGAQARGGDWMSPWMLAGVALGVAILALAVAFVTGNRQGHRR